MTREGLWLSSTADNNSGERFRVMAIEVGRSEKFGVRQQSVAATPLFDGDWMTTGVADFQSGVALRFPPQSKTLPKQGVVSINDQRARFIRPGLTEEYTVSVDGVRQDFVILEKPGGASVPASRLASSLAPPAQGELRVELDVTGAKAEPLVNGVRLVLDGSGRKLAYNRLRVTDATGRELPARMEVGSVRTDQGGASVPASWLVSSLAPPVGASALAVLVDDAAAIYPVRIDPTFSDADWTSLSDLPGANGDVYATVTDELGNLYIGGNFTQVREVIANGIAKWNGSEWSPLMNTGPLPYGFTPGSVVRALAIAGTNLYAGGNFASPSFYNQKVARWNGSAWYPLGTGLGGSGNDNSVYALAVDGTNLYAGGGFTTAGGVTANKIAKWNGNSWSALGSGVGGIVQAIAVSGTNLYAGGQFTSPGNYIAKWNGSTWSPLGLGMNYWVYTLATSGTNLYAGGSFSTAGGVAAYRIARWNGAAWSSMGATTDFFVYALAVSGDDLYASGWFAAPGFPANSIAKWNGTNWSVLGSAFNATVYALAVSGSNVYVGGGFSKAGNTPANSIAKWNGTAWSGWGGGLNGEVLAIAISNTNLYVGGNFTTVVGVAAARVARWNGSVWSALGSGMSGPVRALAVSGTNLYAGGSFTTAGITTVNHIAKWNGAVWSDLDSGMSGGNLYNPTVYALAFVGTNLYAGGFFVTANGIDHLAKWNGHSWSKLGFGINGSARALAVMGTNLFVGGVFTQAGLMTVNRVAKWDGSTWSALGSGMNTEVDALTVSGSDLYAGGEFTTAGGSVANRIAKWDGTAWSGLNLGMNSAVRTLAVSGTELYAGGSFTNAGGIAANNVAKWDGITWSPLGSGTSSTVYALAVSGTNLYAGGSFTMAGDKVSAYTAKANISAARGRFSNPIYYSTTGFSCTFLDGSVGQPYRIQTSPSLAAGSWTDFTNFTYTAPVVITVPVFGNTNRFFRAITP